MFYRSEEPRRNKVGGIQASIMKLLLCYLYRPSLNGILFYSIAVIVIFSGTKQLKGQRTLGANILPSASTMSLLAIVPSSSAHRFPCMMLFIY